MAETRENSELQVFPGFVAGNLPKNPEKLANPGEIGPSSNPQPDPQGAPESGLSPAYRPAGEPRPWRVMKAVIRNGGGPLDRLEQIRVWVDRSWPDAVTGEQWTNLMIDLGEIRDEIVGEIAPPPLDFLELVRRELARATLKFPRRQSGLHEAYAVLLEEVDELWDEIKGQQDPHNLLIESVQIAAMAARLVRDRGLMFALEMPAGDGTTNGSANLLSTLESAPLEPPTGARVRAAAPQLLDSLLAVEWAGSDDGPDFPEQIDCCPNCGAAAPGPHLTGCELRDSLDAALGVTSPRVEVAP